MRRMFAALVVTASLLGTAAAAEFSSIEERMTAAEFRAAGLMKLTDAELAKLNEWLRARAAATLVAPAAVAVDDRQSRIGLPAETSRDVVESTIPGEFRGWGGKGKQFTLANGQVWESVDDTSRLSVRMNDPRVRIAPAMMGGWLMSVDGYNTKVRVRRVQ